MNNLNYCEGTYTTLIIDNTYRPYTYPWTCPCPCERTCPHCGGTGTIPVRPTPRPWPTPYQPAPPAYSWRPGYDPTRGKRY